MNKTLKMSKNNFIKSILVTFIFCCAFQLSSTIDYAQNLDNDKMSICKNNTKPQLNGHEFVTNSLAEGPFLNTSIRLSSGAGISSNYSLPLEINGREVTGLFGQVTYGIFNVRYSQKIKEWLGFAVSANMKGRLGSQTVSILTEGINLGTSFDFGWIVRVFESKKFMLSSTLAVSNQSITVFNLYDYIQKIVQNGEITSDNKMVKSTNITAGGLGLNTAFAFSRTFGCIGKLSFGYGETLTGANRGYFDAGISFDANLEPKVKIPVGFALGYDWNNFSQADVSITNPQNVIFKVSYTGRKDFDLGVEMNAQFLTYTRLKQEINLKVLFIKANIAYFF
jgi:hypothetical protein